MTPLTMAASAFQAIVRDVDSEDANQPAKLRRQVRRLVKEVQALHQNIEATRATSEGRRFHVNLEEAQLLEYLLQGGSGDNLTRDQWSKVRDLRAEISKLYGLAK